ATGVSTGNCGGNGRLNGWWCGPTNTSSATTGTASAVSLSQYWNACTNVIDRMPPKTTVAITTTPAATTPLQDGRFGTTVATVSHAPCSWGNRYIQPIMITKIVHTRCTEALRSRNSAKSGTV